MCGIVGKLYFDPQKAVSPELIRKMAGTISYRGPDDEGVWARGPIGLGHQRLSILDLSHAGHQPMSDPEETVHITYNGEIYNFLELRKDLEEKGYHFRSRTDTEVILYLYKEYGEECLRYLRGMFAFAIWDDKQGKLLLARDRVGKKPLKYFLGPDFLVFASELKALFPDPAVPREPDWVAIDQYLTYQYVPAPLTGFSGIRKLPPGHCLLWHRGKLELKRYWKLDYSKKLSLSEREWEERILAKLEECVRVRMIADVPLGAWLSGGIDSSTIVALMTRLSSSPVKTFSIGFPEKEYNELPYARAVAKGLGTDHHEFFVTPECLSILPELVRHYEEPFADSAAIPTWYLSRLTRQHVTVVLNGDGGDENFAGYNALFYHALTAKWRKWTGGGVLNQPAAILSDILAYLLQNRRFKTTANLLRHAGEPHSNYIRSMIFFSEEEKSNLYTPGLRDRIGQGSALKVLEEAFLDSGVDDPLDQALYANMVTYLPGALLPKVDIASMAFALEARSPLLDHQFLELAAQVPSSLKIRRLTKKYLLRKVTARILPKEVASQRKRGFAVPLDRWLSHDLKDQAREDLLNTCLTQWSLFRKEAIADMFNNHLSGRENHANHIWALLVLGSWLETFFPHH